MNANERYLDRKLGLQWLAACALGIVSIGLFGIGAAWMVSDLVWNNVGETAGYLTAGALIGAVLGLSASIGPGLLLQRRGLPASRWVGASVLAGALGVAAGLTIEHVFLEPPELPDVVSGLLFGLFLGLPVGLGQWLAARRSGLLPGAWVLVTGLAFLIALTAGLPLGGEGRELLSIGVIGLLAGAITGLGAAWFLSRPASIRDASPA